MPSDRYQSDCCQSDCCQLDCCQLDCYQLDCYQNEIRDIIKYSALGYERFLTSAAGGNVSCRCRDGVLITAGGVSLRCVTEQDILLTDLYGTVLANPHARKPSKEMMFHLAIYRQRPEVNFVYHVHPPFTTAFACRGLEVPFITSASRAKIGRAPLIPYEKPGSAALAHLVSDTLEKETPDVHVLTMAQHGLVAFHENAEECYFLAELLEDTAKIAWLAQLIQIPGE